MELIIDRLSKQYKNKIAVDRISLTLHQGVYGLLGANGAGKTTLMRMLCGILRPTSGTVMFENMDVSTEDYRKELGYLPQDFGYYPNFTGRDFLMYMAVLKGMTKSRAQKRCAKPVSYTHLDVYKRQVVDLGTDPQLMGALGAAEYARQKGLAKRKGR